MPTAEVVTKTPNSRCLILEISRLVSRTPTVLLGGSRAITRFFGVWGSRLQRLCVGGSRLGALTFDYRASCPLQVGTAKMRSGFDNHCRRSRLHIVAAHQAAGAIGGSVIRPVASSLHRARASVGSVGRCPRESTKHSLDRQANILRSGSSSQSYLSRIV